MYEGYARQYGTSCVVIEEGDNPDEVIEFAEEVEAKTYEGENEVIVVQFPGRPGPECYSERALRASMK